MNYCLQCKKCGERWWCKGVYESDTNALTLTGDMQDCPECGSDDHEVIDEEDNFYDD